MKQCAIPINIRSVLRVAAFIVALCLAGHVTPAQAQPCGGQWLPGDGASDMNGTVYATTMWDPDGAGPQPAVLVAGGTFTTAGGVNASRIARWNGTAWSPLGTGMNSSVEALAVLPNGDLVAGGSFTTAGGVTASRIARWNGTAWSPLGTGMSNTVRALAVLPNGDLVAGGTFTTAGGVSANAIARWNGTAWSPLGTGINNFVDALAVLPNGDLVAGGWFTHAGGVSVNYIARWNGTAWSSLGTGMNNNVYALAVLPSGDQVAGGDFTTAGGNVSAYFARWTETNIPWIALQPQPQTLASGQTLNLSATPANGYANVSVQWQRNGVPITNGPGGASPGGGTVSGAFGPLPSPTIGTPATLTITSATPTDSGAYTAVFSNACGSATSTAAAATVNCRADLTTNAIPGTPGYGVPNGILNNDDFFYYLSQFAAGNLVVADLTTGAVPGQPGYGVPNGLLNNDDFFYYLTIFAAGC